MPSALLEDQSKQRVLRAALELMSERGYAGTSISMITRRSGLPASSTYWHFGSKEALLASVVEYAASRWLASLPRWDEMTGTPRERFGALLDDAADAFPSQTFLRLLILLSLERGNSEESIEVIRKVRWKAAAGFRKAFSEIFADSDDAAVAEFSESIATFALAVSDGVFLASQIDPDVNVALLYRFLQTAFLALGDQFIASQSPSVAANTR